MNKLKIESVGPDSIEFENGVVLKSEHEQDCCENHWLDFSDLEIQDFKGLEFDLSNDNFFERLPGYGIALNPTNGFPVRIPGYGSNNGYYSSDLRLVLINNQGNILHSYDVSECQDISE